jgi:hypothetical protein
MRALAGASRVTLPAGAGSVIGTIPQGRILWEQEFQLVTSISLPFDVESYERSLECFASKG